MHFFFRRFAERPRRINENYYRKRNFNGVAPFSPSRVDLLF